MSVKVQFPLVFEGINLPLFSQGKTRDIYELPQSPHLLLVVASDRLSTHNIVHQSVIDNKGQVLTALTIFWLTEVLADFSSHLVAWGRDIYKYLPPAPGSYPANLHLQAIVVRRLTIDPIEYILRAYNAGSYAKGLRSGWIEYQGVDPYGYAFARDMPLMRRFNPSLFTPTNKSEHDEPRRALEVEAQYTQQVQLIRRVFLRAQHFLNARGVELIDTKFELGTYRPTDPIRNEVPAGMIKMPLLADEILTPDSSRFALLANIQEGEDPPWLDKQIARDAAESTWAGGSKYPLTFPSKILNGVRTAYLKLFEKITGRTLFEFQRNILS